MLPSVFINAASSTLFSLYKLIISVDDKEGGVLVGEVVDGAGGSRGESLLLMSFNISSL